jgi:adenine phosphoribosyltransferase
MNTPELVRANILDVPDFPSPGIVFKDITPVLSNSIAFGALIDHIAEECNSLGITQVVGIESRGFIFGAAVAYALGTGLTIVRKPRKLPRQTRSVTYDLEYGTDTLHIHHDALVAGDRVLVVDDVLATGGTAAATAKLIEACGAEVVRMAFVIELDFLGGRAKLPGRDILTVVHY